MIRTLQLLVINQAQLDWPHQKGFSCKRIEEHKQESINTQSEIADMNDANSQMRVQELGSKGLIDTVEEIKNGGPGSLQKDLSLQLQWTIQFLDGKLNSKTKPKSKQ